MTRTLKILDGLTGICLIVFVLFSMFSISVTQIALGLGALVWLARTQLTGSWKDQQWPLGIPFLVFSLACLLAVLTAVDPAVSLKPLKKLLLILTVFWVANTVQGARQRDLLVLLLVISACGASLYGFYQAFTTSVTLKTRVEGTMSIYMTFAGLLMLVGLLSLARFLFRKPREPGMGLAAGLILICLLL
ncbi:MAG: hypothetical protein GWM98_06160, partial [Nitrospinaceae bacterium]|nr:hypothetical protein [Nitrospinaceae bacterium]NIR54147.1 hypothetical protein [Nitrospinaceae bacterium]NIS84561.1 hypothetical protein [Nitrospinaceae bacterium]NIT81353.1 hypothetical protein [Nitrospinaceae bacterium]NIU43640.1 hypothetical protein [Nitrospinaceae bacterium]